MAYPHKLGNLLRALLVGSTCILATAHGARGETEEASSVPASKSAEACKVLVDLRDGELFRTSEGVLKGIRHAEGRIKIHQGTVEMLQEKVRYRNWSGIKTALLAVKALSDFGIGVAGLINIEAAAAKEAFGAAQERIQMYLKVNGTVLQGVKTASAAGSEIASGDDDGPQRALLVAASDATKVILKNSSLFGLPAKVSYFAYDSAKNAVALSKGAQESVQAQKELDSIAADARDALAQIANDKTELAILKGQLLDLNRVKGEIDRVCRSKKKDAASQSCVAKKAALTSSNQQNAQKLYEAAVAACPASEAANLKGLFGSAMLKSANASASNSLRDATLAVRSAAAAGAIDNSEANMRAIQRLQGSSGFGYGQSDVSTSPQGSGLDMDYISKNCSNPSAVESLSRRLPTSQPSDVCEAARMMDEGASIARQMASYCPSDAAKLNAQAAEFERAAAQNREYYSQTHTNRCR